MSATTATMGTVFLTRPEYDALVTAHPAYMANVYGKLTGLRWSLAGVMVPNCPAELYAMHRQLAECPGCELRTGGAYCSHHCRTNHMGGCEG